MLLFSGTKEKKLKISNVLKMADEKQFEAGKTSSGKCITLYYSCLVLFFFALIFYKITFFCIETDSGKKSQGLKIMKQLAGILC